MGMKKNCLGLRFRFLWQQEESDQFLKFAVCANVDLTFLQVELGLSKNLVERFLDYTTETKKL